MRCSTCATVSRSSSCGHLVPSSSRSSLAPPHTTPPFPQATASAGRSFVLLPAGMATSCGEAVYFNTIEQSWQLGWRVEGGVKDEKGKVWKGVKEVYVIMDDASIDMDTEDLLKLNELHEGALLRCVQRRHSEDKIYTFIGPSVILSINPWKFTIPAYTDDKIPLYITGEKGIPPHIWTIGRMSYDNMMETRQNQTVLVSGESGAGKTEAVKSLLKFLGALSASRAGGLEGDAPSDGASQTPVAEAAPQTLQQKIEACNPILETFGNAKTVRNDNSSRFGKFLKVAYDEDGRICGARTINYLLERSRVIGCGPQERVFHSFYQILASKDGQEKYGLDAARAYPSVGSHPKIENVDDAKEYEETCHAMEVMGFTEAERDATWSLVAGILHLMRVSFDTDPETDETVLAASAVEVLGKCAKCWSVSADDLQRDMLQVTVKAGNERVIRKHSLQKAASVRDALCKEVYASLFQWLIFRINATMAPDEMAEASWIGLLDIFGFEHFQHNSLEQLCINLANEMLQNHYNQHIFTADIEECRSEGIETQHVEFQDNQAVVSMVAHSKDGILAHLDDQCKTRPEDDDAFLERVTQEFSKKPAFFRSALDRDSFRLQHYAAEVRYCVTNFGEKNLDSVQDSLLDIVRNSANDAISGILRSAETAKSNESVTGIFKRQLNELLEMINQTKPSWIRCIKPHPVKRPKLFDPVTSMAQLCSSGVLETVRVRKSGYPVRLPHALFVNRFRILLPKELRQQWKDETLDPVKGCKAILEKLGLGAEKAQIGHTKVFLRTFAHTEMEDVRMNAYAEYATTIRSWSVTALAVQDLFNRKHQGLLKLLRAQQHERSDLEAGEKDARVAVDADEAAAFAGDIAALEAGEHRAAFERWHASSAADVCAEEAEEAVHLRNHCADLRALHDEGERLRFERVADAARAAEVELWEQEGFLRIVLLSEEDVLATVRLMGEKGSLEEEQEEEKRRVVAINERRERRVVDLEAAEDRAAVELLCEEAAALLAELCPAAAAVADLLLESERAVVRTEEEAARQTAGLLEEQAWAFLGLSAEEDAGVRAAAAFGGAFWSEVHRGERQCTEDEETAARDAVEAEEEAAHGAVCDAFEEGWARAAEAQAQRETSEFQAMEHINRLRIEEVYVASLPHLRHERSRVRVRLLQGYMEDCVREETDRRADITEHYAAFWNAIHLAWATAHQKVLLQEVEGECWAHRRGIEGLYAESRAQLETLSLQNECRVAAIDRARELEMVYAKLDSIVDPHPPASGRGRTTSQSPLPFRHGTCSPSEAYTQKHLASSPPPALPPPSYGQSLTPSRAGMGAGASRVSHAGTAAKSPVHSSVSRDPHDPFKDGTWLWRAMYPSVSKRWTKVFVKALDGELKWYTNESADPKSFKLSNVINIEAHDLPDKDGYRAPNEMSATIAKRISSSCRHSAIKLTLKQKEGTGEINKAIFLCAEFPAVAVMWLRRLRLEWASVCDKRDHPHGEDRKAEACVPAKASIDLSPLLGACPDSSEAVGLVKDLRKWLRRAKKAGFPIAPTLDLRQFCQLQTEGQREPSPPGHSVSASPARGGSRPATGYARSASPYNSITAYDREYGRGHPSGYSRSPSRAVNPPLPYGLGGDHGSLSHCRSHAGCGYSRRSVARACEGGGGNVYSSPRILGMKKTQGPMVGQIKLGEGGDEDGGGGHGDGDSDLSEDIPIDERVNMILEARRVEEEEEGDDETGRTRGYRGGTDQIEHWRNVWQETFAFQRRVKRSVLIRALEVGKDNTVRKELAKATVHTTPATLSCIDVFLKRVFHEHGDLYIEEDEFVTWCTAGGDTLGPCKVIHASQEARDAAPAACIAAIAAAAQAQLQERAQEAPPPPAAPPAVPVTPAPSSPPRGPSEIPPKPAAAQPPPQQQPQVQAQQQPQAAPAAAQAPPQQQPQPQAQTPPQEPVQQSHEAAQPAAVAEAPAPPPAPAPPAAEAPPPALPVLDDVPVTVSESAPSPETSPAAPAEEAGGEPWECDECMMENEGGDTECCACGLAKP